MTLHHRLPRLAAAAALVLTLGLGACGGDGSGDGAGAGATASEAAEDNEHAGDDHGTGSAAEATATDKVPIVDFAYKPETVKVKAGTEVTWTNEDSFAHTVTADDKSFDSKNMEKDATFKHRFDTAGTFKYF